MGFWKEVGEVLSAVAEGAVQKRAQEGRDEVVNHMVATLSGKTWDSDRLELLKFCAPTGLNGPQAARILKTFAFDDVRANAARILIPKLESPMDKLWIVDAFTFRSVGMDVIKEEPSERS